MMCVKKCGTCCKFLFFEYIPGMLDNGTKELLKLRGAIFFNKCYALPSRCKHLDTDDLCKIYTDRPKACRLFNCKKFKYGKQLAVIFKNSL